MNPFSHNSLVSIHHKYFIQVIDQTALSSFSQCQQFWETKYLVYAMKNKDDNINLIRWVKFVLTNTFSFGAFHRI